MTFRVNGILDINFQGLNLNCGRYCLEAVMRWKHGSSFGAVQLGPPVANAHGNMVGNFGAARTAHAAGVQAHMDAWFKIGFDPGNHMADYGLVTFTKPTSAAGWEAALRIYGPLMVSGHIGAVRIIPLMAAGHYVVVIGVDANNDIEYYDPLRPDHALGGDPETQTFAKFDELAYTQVYAVAQ